MCNERVNIKRGDIFYIDIPKDESNPRKQCGCRPCVITSNNDNNHYSDIIDYVPLTSKIKKENLPVNAVLNTTRCLKMKSMALCNHFGSIDKTFIREKIGSVSEEDMFKIELGLMNQQGINVFLFMKNMKQLNYA